MGCGISDAGRCVSGWPIFQLSNPLLGCFTCYEGFFRQISDRPLLYALFSRCVRANRVILTAYQLHMIKIYHKHKPVLLITILTLFIFNASLSFAGQYKATRVTDGDTIQVIADGTKTTIRLVDIDAPEVSHAKNQPGQPFGEAATKHLTGIVLNKSVEIKSYGPDRSGLNV